MTDLAAALDREFGTRPRLLTLASVDVAGKPHARMVVCRDLQPDGSLIIVSDSRSDKNRQLRSNAVAEAVIWIAGDRVQFRISGVVSIKGAADKVQIIRHAVWSTLSPASRALFYWPTPGEARSPDSAFVGDLPESTPAPANFEVLVLMPENVDRLDTSKRPHHRRVWSKKANWIGADVNP